MNKRFALIELITAIVVIAIIAAIILLNVSKIKDRALDTAKVANLAEMQKIVDMYYLERDMYPTIVQPNLGPEKVEQSMLVTKFQKKKIKYEFCVQPTGEVIFFEDCDSVALDELPLPVEVLTCEEALQVGYEKCIHNQEELKSIEDGQYSRYIVVNDFSIEDDWDSIVLPDINSEIELNGNGYSISNLSINTTADKSGMFAESNDITIKNLKLMNAKMHINGHSYSGLLVGYTNGSVNLDNITVFSEITGEGDFVGGLIGSSENKEGKTIDSNAINIVGKIKINLTSGENIGGLFGYNVGNINAVNLDVDITGAGDNYGGVAGSQISYANIDNKVSNIHSVGRIENNGSLTGLVFGELYNGIGHNNISAKGTVIGRDLTGGIVGLVNSPLKDISFVGEVSGTDSVGGISGDGMFSKVNEEPSNIQVKGSIYGTGSQIGGISGLLRSNTTKGFKVDVRVVGEGEYVGGLFGLSYDEISDVTGEVIVTGKSGLVGGVTGGNQSTLSNAQLKGEVYGSGSFIGGISGQSNDDIMNIHFEGIVNSLNSEQSYHEGLGGIVGDLNARMKDASFKGSILANEKEVGAIVGSNSGSLENVSAEASIESTNGYLGGIAGYAYSPINNATFKGTVTSTSGDFVGGLSGFQVAPATDITIDGIISSNGDYTGGLIGQSHTDIIKSTFTGDIIAKGNYVGGIAGSSSGGSKLLGVIGSISAEGNYVGGLFGQNYAPLEDSYVVASIDNTGDYTGGLVGEMYGTYARKVYFSGTISGTNFVDPIFAEINEYSYRDIQNDLDSVMYWNSDLYSGSSIGLGSGKTDTQLKDISNFTGWDLENTWVLDGYLKLK